MKRRRIQPNEKVTVCMSACDRELLLKHALGDPEYAERLRPAPAGKGLVGEYTLDDIEDILGYVAAEANHTGDKKLRGALDALSYRLHRAQGYFFFVNCNDSAL